MKKIAVIALLHVFASLPAYAVDEASPELNLEIPNPPADEATRLFVERLKEMGRFGLLQVGDGFSLYGQLSVPRLAAVSGMPRNSAAGGLHVQFDGVRGVGLHFGWDRYVAGPDSGGSLYTLGATLRF